MNNKLTAVKKQRDRAGSLTYQGWLFFYFIFVRRKTAQFFFSFVSIDPALGTSLPVI